jgi:predicted Zn-dependent protease
MATYLELARITQENDWGDFIDKVETACVIKATAIIDSTSPTQVAKDWAEATIKTPATAALSVVWYVIGSNDNLAIATILSASDSAIQTNVDAAVDVLYP